MPNRNILLSAGTGNTNTFNFSGIIPRLGLQGAPHWIYNASPVPGRLQINYAGIGASVVNNVYVLEHRGLPYIFDSSKTYQFITHTVNLYAVHASFSVLPPWPSNQSDELKYYNGMSASSVAPTLDATQSFFHYSKPASTLISTSHVTYKANGTFSSQGVANEGITDFVVNELDFEIQGFSYYRLTNIENLPNVSNSLGWYYNKNSDQYHWYDRITGSPSSNTAASLAGYFPVGGPNGSKKSNIGYRLNNALVKFVPYSYFNFSFSYQNQSDFPLKIYISSSPPSKSPSTFANLVSGGYIPPTGSILLATLTQSVSASGATSLTSSISQSFYGVRGNQYLTFVGGFAGASSSGTTYSSIYLSNIKIDGGYHPGNNRQYVMDETLVSAEVIIDFTAYLSLFSVPALVTFALVVDDPNLGNIALYIDNGITFATLQDALDSYVISINSGGYAYYATSSVGFMTITAPLALGSTINGNIASWSITIDTSSYSGSPIFVGGFSSVSPIGLTGATYTARVGTGNTVNSSTSLLGSGIGEIYSKIGNGKFKSGIWENGVWNSGWRVDEGMYEFYNVNQFFGYNRNRRWRLQITGPTSSVSNFNIGDNVSIGNIIAIDINEDRKTLKSYYTIINKTNNSIIVEFDNNFPIRRVKKDSDYHRIYVTKNVWLSGGFLNGYFTGVWSYGLFKGYPLITEMYDTSWIDGIFDGGHFKSSEYTIPNFVNTLFQSGSVGLTFSTPHGLAVGDLITINKTDKTINPQYDGEHYVTEVVNDYQIKTDIDWGSDSASEGGSVTIEMSRGLLQKVKFKSNNISEITSNNSLESNSVFVYNSWMDVLFDTSYATNIGKPQMLLNSLSRNSYSENNLYGYITNDILESDSTFRDSFSTTIRSYRLGTKYRIFSDFIGDAGKFQTEFGGSFKSPFSNQIVKISGEDVFIKDGWTFSRWDVGSLTFSRPTYTGVDSTTGEELLVQAVSSGGILDVTPFSENDILNKTYEEVQRLRYTKVEFDLVTYSNIISEYSQIPTNDDTSYEHLPYSYNYNNVQVPPIHFNNLNLVNRTLSISGNRFTFELSSVTPATYLPVYDNVNHLLTQKVKKSEYFYNKRNLAMHFYGYSSYLPTTTVEYLIDNLHFYEVDMIPFFQYFTEENINKGIQIPYQGISPFIDYTNSNFNFIDNISVGLDSIQTQNSSTVISGVGDGVGVQTPGDIFNEPRPRSGGINLDLLQ
jgi:hypothetical protein